MEPYGFGGTVNVIGQNAGKWDDCKDCNTLTGTTGPRVYNAEFSQKFFFPADWEVYVTFEPTQNYNNADFKSKSGKFQMHAGF
mgnify:CR=1 FL=1